MKRAEVVLLDLLLQQLYYFLTILNSTLNDSKQLSERHVKTKTYNRTTISFAVAHLEPLIIDEINILNASIKAMQECILKLDPRPVSNC
jgi:ribonuclease HII